METDACLEFGRAGDEIQLAVEKILVVTNERGLHLTSAAKIAKRARKFVSRIDLIKGNQVADAKSVLNIAGLMAPMGTRLRVVAEGDDEAEAVEALKELFDKGFEEDE
jgi:phosphocarrier protein